MSLFGAMGRLGIKKLDKSLKDKKNSRINMIKNGNYLKFAEDIDDINKWKPKFNEFKNLPKTYFSLPDEEKEKELLYEMAGKLLKTEEYRKIAEENITYFMMVNVLTGQPTNGLIATSAGIFDSNIFTPYIPINEIDSIESDKGWLYILKKDNTKVYLTAMDNKKVKEQSEKFLKLLKIIYNL